MVRALVELAVDRGAGSKAEEVQEKAKTAGEGRRLGLLPPPSRVPGPGEDPATAREQASRTRERMRESLREGRLDDRSVEVEVRESAMPSFEIIAGTSVEEIGVNLKDMMGNMFQGRTKPRRLKVPEAMQHLIDEEQGKLVDMESVGRAAVQRVEHGGIIFIDEIDKIASRDGMAGGGHGRPDGSPEGGQAAILPDLLGKDRHTT